MKLIGGVIVVVLVLAGGALWWQHRAAQPKIVFRTAPVQQGDLLATISAPGTLEPEEVVDVGAQVAGMIKTFGADPQHPGKTVDYGTDVEVGTILAQIDDVLYKADTDSAEAQLGQAKANEQQAIANIDQLDAKLFQCGAEFDRYQKLGVPVVAQTDYDLAKANYLTAQAQRKMGDAAVAQCAAAVKLAQANYDKAKQNQSYCTITSPVKGVIIDRRVNIGQTVVSSLNTPSLFLIAKDLKRMQIWSSVNEADIDNIHSGQQVTFTVEGLLGQTFRGVVNKVRYNASMTQNVVTYTVEITTDNSDNKLLPYKSTNVQFEVSRRSNVLKAPNAALRWMPESKEVDPVFRGQYLEESATSHKKRVWIEEPGGLLKPVEVMAGASDGVDSEIQSSELHSGDPVVVGQEEASVADSGTSPFMPHFGGNKK